MRIDKSSFRLYNPAVQVYELIRAKREGRALTRQEIEFLVSGLTRGTIPEYQFAAFLMAVFFRGMTFDETFYLTAAMMHSGRVFDLKGIPGRKVDKHSTGGVGDKVSLILAPLVAACGVCVPMVSGRGLGHTGGTLDKLESIPGFRTDLKYSEFRRVLKRVGCAIMGQTAELTPADKKIYALRDVTATVDSIPLIAASIMSKKLAEGIDALVLDVKCGQGAFMADIRSARQLARTMIAIGQRMNKPVAVLITSMDQPLGRMVGNALEMIEAIETLKGKGEPDVLAVVRALATEMLLLGSTVKMSRARAETRLRQALQSGAALNRFRQMIAAQGGDVRIIDDYTRLPTARYKLPVHARQNGFVQEIDTLRVGLLAVELGAGRATKEATIDPAVGFRFHCKVGDRVPKGQILADVFANEPRLGARIAQDLSSCFRLGPKQPAPPRLIRERIRS